MEVKRAPKNYISPVLAIDLFIVFSVIIAFIIDYHLSNSYLQMAVLIGADFIDVKYIDHIINKEDNIFWYELSHDQLHYNRKEHQFE